MQPNRPNAFVYIFPALALVAVLVYFLYGAADRLGLETREAQALVTGKQFTPGSTTYNTNVVAGRTWTEASKYPDAYVVALQLDGEATAGMVSPQMYESLSPGERVRVSYRRTRFSKRILVTDVRR
jgi:hypothetical protein